MDFFSERLLTQRTLLATKPIHFFSRSRYEKMVGRSECNECIISPWKCSSTHRINLASLAEGMYSLIQGSLSR